MDQKPSIVRTASEDTPTASSASTERRVKKELPERKKGAAGGKGGTKRSKFRTDEERMVKEKERRNANNQRERSATSHLELRKIMHLCMFQTYNLAGWQNVHY